MKNIHLIPTNKPSRLYLHSDGELQLRTNIIRTSEDYFGSNQHIYITNSEEIKEGDWIKWGDAIYKANKKYTPPFKKIILSTDPQLIQDGIQAIPDDFLEWFVKNPSCQYGGYKDIPWDKIITLKEEPKQETLEEAAEKYTEGNDLEYAYMQEIPAFKAGAKWQQERGYSEADMKNAFDSAREFNSLDGVVDVHIVLPMGGDMSDLQPLHFTFEEWFEQFKNK